MATQSTDSSNIEVLDQKTLIKWCTRLGIYDAAANALIETARTIGKDTILTQIFEDFYKITVLGGDWHREWSPLPMDPLVKEKMGNRSSLFYLIAYMAALPLVEREYFKREISGNIFTDTMHDIPFYYLEDSDVHGDWYFDHFPWLWRHLTCQLFRLGRLQFMLAPFDWGVTAFRSKQNGEIILFADPQIPLRQDGYAKGAGGQPSDESPWSAHYIEREDGWAGTPVSPYGFAVQKSVFLKRKEWDIVLQKGDTILDIHIPRGKMLSPDECRESITNAYHFFGRQHPGVKIAAGFCHTWFFTPQLQKILPQTSSIVQFQREFYLFPHPGGPDFLWTFVFGGKYTTPESAPRDTSLRRAVLDWMNQGKELFDLPGVMFHPAEMWGTQPYMKRWDEDKAFFSNI